MSIDFEEGTNQLEITQDQLKTISYMAAQVLEYEEKVELAELALKNANRLLRGVQQVELPEAMEAAGMKKFTTVDGLTIAVSNKLKASVTKANKAEAAIWLTNNELGSLVSRDITISFDNDQADEVVKTIALLESAGVPNVTQSVDMNTARIKSAINERVEEGKDTPMELFGAYFLKKAVVKK